MNKGLAGLLAAGIVGAAVAMLGGCEGGEGVDGESFRIDPSESHLSPSNPTVILTAIGGHAPLTWTVSDTTLGTLSGSGQVVTYTRTDKNGVNTVLLTDGLGWTATAVIGQGDEPEAPTPAAVLAISPSAATLNANGDRLVFQASGGGRPYSWSVGDAGRGSIGASGDTQAIYTRLATGNNSVTVRDREGRVAMAQISQPPVAALAISPATAAVSTNGGTVVFTAAGGSGAYTWTINSGPGALSPVTGSSSVLTLAAGSSVTTVVQLDDTVSTVFATVTRF